MAFVEVSLQGLNLGLRSEGGKSYLQVCEWGFDPSPWIEVNKDNLAAVTNGLRYHLTTGNDMLSLHRDEGTLVVEYQGADHPIIVASCSIEAYNEAVQRAVKPRPQGYAA